MGLVIVLPALLASSGLPAGWITGLVLAVVVALLLSGIVPYVRSVRMSRG
jgi:hypothetical protein